MWNALTEYFMYDLMRQQARAFLKTLAQPDDVRNGIGLQALRQWPQARHRRSDDQQALGTPCTARNMGDRLLEIICDAQGIRQRETRQVKRIFTFGGRILHRLLVSSPEYDVMMIGKRDGERRAPGACAEYADVHVVLVVCAAMAEMGTTNTDIAVDDAIDTPIDNTPQADVTLPILR